MRRAERIRRIQKHAKARALKVVPPVKKEGLAALCDLMEVKLSKLRAERDEAVEIIGIMIPACNSPCRVGRAWAFLKRIRLSPSKTSLQKLIQ